MNSDGTPRSAQSGDVVRVIMAADVAAWRASLYGDGVIDAAEAEVLCRREREAISACPQWRAFYVEALTDFVVRQQPPQGYVTDASADWLMAQVSDAAGAIASTNALELVIHVMETATEVPARLAAFALAQVARAIVEGDGPLAGRNRLEPGRVSREEVELLRRILFAFGHEGTVGISREEAEVLFDINDHTREADNDPAWSDLFVKAIANFLMAARGYTVLTRAEALGREAWLDAPERGVTALFGDMLSSMLSSSLRGVWSAWEREEGASAARDRQADAARQAAEVVTSAEVRWLADRIGRDGVIHANERALLKFLSEESPDIHPSLRTLLDTAA